jgi:hypothetical protein
MKANFKTVGARLLPLTWDNKSALPLVNAISLAIINFQSETRLKVLSITRGADDENGNHSFQIHIAPNIKTKAAE